MKPNGCLLGCLLAVVLFLVSGCAAAPLAMYAGSAVAGGYHYGSTMMGLGSSGGNNGAQQDGGVIVYRDGNFAREIARKALKNLGIPLEKGDAVCGTTKDGVKVEVEIIEKTPKLTEIKISAKKNSFFTDQVIARMVSEEIKRLAGIKS